MPLTVLVRGLGSLPQAVADGVSALRFRNTILVYLNVGDPGLFKDQWLYIHSPELGMGLQTREEMEDVIEVRADGSYIMSTEDLRSAEYAAPTTPAEVIDQSTGEVTQGASTLQPYSEMLDRIQKCNDIDVLDICADEVRDYPEDERVKLEQAYMDRREILTGA